MNEGLLDIISQLNEELLESNRLHPEVSSLLENQWPVRFQLHSDGFINQIVFMDYPLWSSEDPDVWDEETEEAIPLKTHLARQLSELLLNLSKIRLPIEWELKA